MSTEPRLLERVEDEVALLEQWAVSAEKIGCVNAAASFRRKAARLREQARKDEEEDGLHH